MGVKKKIITSSGADQVKAVLSVWVTVMDGEV